MTEWCPVHGPDPRGGGPTEVLLMADYGCFLWTNSPELARFRDGEGNLDAAQLDVSADLIARMRTWHADWEEMAYSNVGFSSRKIERAWQHRGWELAHELQDELPHIEVHYQYDSRGPLPVRNRDH